MTLSGCCLSVCLPCWEDRREEGEEGKKLNVIISLAFALHIGSLELSPHHSLGAVKVRRLKARWLQKATAAWLRVLHSWWLHCPWPYIGPALAEPDSPRSQPQPVKCLSSWF